MGKTILSRELTPAGIPVYSAGRDAGPWGYVLASDVVFSHGTIVVSARGTIGFARLPVDSEFISTQTTIAATPHGIDSRWLTQRLGSLDWAQHTSTTTIPMLTIRELSSIEVLVPPLAEQRRIVARLDELLARSRKARESLARLPALLDNLRQSVLAAAFRGDLTKEWREAHPDVEPAEKLLERIREDALGKRPKKEAAPDADRGEWSFSELPHSWAWAFFDDMCSDETCSDRKLKQELYSQSGEIRVVDQGARLVGGYSDDRGLAYSGRLPVVVFGDHTRCVKFVDFEFVQGADGVKVLAPRPQVDPRYFFFAMRGVQLPDRGYSRHFKFLRPTLFPLAPREEQQEIVRRLDDALSAIDSISNQGEAQLARLNTLDQSLLAKAFRGELVPQDPSDEPASVLLERLRAEREASGEKPARGRKPKSAAKAAKASRR